MARVAIIGAGVAGLAAAFKLRSNGIEAVVFERDRRVGGRVSTVERNSLRFDDGAQFVRTDTSISERILRRELPAEGMVDVRREVRPFDRTNRLGPGDQAQNAEPKWVYREGLAALPILLSSAANARIQLGWEVDRLSSGPGGWSLIGSKGNTPEFVAVIVTCPAPLAARLLERSGLMPDAVGELNSVAYRSIISVAFEAVDSVEPPENAYALVNSDRKHDVSWLAFEEAKPGYVPQGRQLIVAQMADSWSAGRLADPDREVANAALRSVSLLLAAPLKARWYHVTRWPHALPNNTLAVNALVGLEEHGLFGAGDAFTGGRVHLALQSGIDAAERATAWLLSRR